MIGDAQPAAGHRRLDHRNIVGAVAHRQRGAHRRAVGFEQRLLGGGIDNGFGHGAGQHVDITNLGDIQPIGQHAGKPDFARHRHGKGHETARNEQRARAVGGHRLHQLSRSGVQPHAFLAALVERGDGQALQQRHAGLQGAGKIQLAAHGRLGDGGDFGLDAGIIGQFIDAFAGDHGGIHVGHDQFLAAWRGAGLHHHVNGGQGVFQRSADGGGIAAGQDVVGVARLQPALRHDFGANAAHDIACRRSVAGRQGAFGNQGDDERVCHFSRS